MIFGKYVNFFQKLEFSYHDQVITIVAISGNGSVIKVSRFQLTRLDQQTSYGECVEPSSTTNEPCYKKIVQYQDQKIHNIDIDEFKMEPNDKKPDHSSKLIVSTRYQFYKEDGEERVKISKVQPGSQIKMSGPQCGWMWRYDSCNRRYFDVPLNKVAADKLWMDFWTEFYTLPTPDFSGEDDDWLLLGAIEAEILNGVDMEEFDFEM